jgi:flagellar hook-basal body complex protein FliE
MQVNPISSAISGIGNLKNITGSGESFTNIFGDALNNLKQTEAVAETENAKLLTGESDDIHTAMIASQKAEVAVNLAVQIRDRVLTAYNEVMNMQI